MMDEQIMDRPLLASKMMVAGLPSNDFLGEEFVNQLQVVWLQ